MVVESSRYNKGFSKLLGMIMLEKVGYRINMSSWRHIVRAIGIRHGLAFKANLNRDRPEMESEGKESDSNMFHAQSDHPKRIGESKYARNMNTGSGVIMNVKQKHKDISLGKHHILGLASIKSTRLGKSRKS